MKIIAKIDIYTEIKDKENRPIKIDAFSKLTVDYFDDNTKKVWVVREGADHPVGDLWMSIDCFVNFFTIANKN